MFPWNIIFDSLLPPVSQSHFYASLLSPSGTLTIIFSFSLLLQNWKFTSLVQFLRILFNFKQRIKLFAVFNFDATIIRFKILYLRISIKPYYYPLILLLSLMQVYFNVAWPYSSVQSNNGIFSINSIVSWR